MLEDFPKKSLNNPGLNERFSYVSTCRSAIGITLDMFPDTAKIALLPAFTCESVLVSFLDRGYEVYPYPIRKDLTIDWEYFQEAVAIRKPSVVLVHSFCLQTATTVPYMHLIFQHMLLYIDHALTSYCLDHDFPS